MKNRKSIFLLYIIPLLVMGFIHINVSAETLDLTSEIEEMGLTVLTDTELINERGGYYIDLLQYFNSEQNATLQDNWLEAGTNGANIIDGNAFSGAMGFTSVIQNSGNNVIIQESTLVNIIFNQ